jgi:hypothetical protein
MRRLALTLAVLLGSTALTVGVAASAPAHAQVEGYPTYEEVGLVWTRRPSVRDMARFYRTTRHDGRRGLAQILCTADVEGRLDCSILDEEPNDREFGLAGVRVMERARVAAADGGSPAGRQFAFTLRFGNWPASQLPDRFQPVGQNLLWVERPTLVGVWGMSGQDRGERIAATVNCIARADGSLGDCELLSADTPDFGEAALTSMGEARVRRADSGVLAGSPLRWTLAVERQSGCAASSSGSGRSGQFPALTTGTSPNVIGAGANGESVMPGDIAGMGAAVGRDVSETRRGMPGCQAAMVQVMEGN